MKPITYQQIRHSTGAKPLTPIPAHVPKIEAVCINSKRMESRPSAFVALRGERFDGHDFLAEAAGGGAVVAVVEQMPAAPPPNLHLLQVPDAYVALGKLARLVRQQMKCKVIAVAGSNGKTSTKHLIDAALRGKLHGSVSPKSFNNNVGVPLTIFPADPMQDYLVLEMGTNHHGEIQPLSEMARPDIAVITSVGAEHLEGLGDLMGVRRENATITAGMSPKGMLVVNGDDKEMVDAVSGYDGQRVTFGFDESNDLFAADVQCDETGVRFLLNGRREVFVPLLGRHTASNALAAVAVGRKLMVPEDVIIEGLAGAEGPDMRLQYKRAGEVTVLNDAYNANPSSMRAAIETLAGLKPEGRRIAVLGDMRELGQATERYHREIGEYAATSGGLDLLVCIGQKSDLIAEAAVAAGLDATAVHRYPDAPAAALGLPRLLQAGDLVLLKASRAMRLETLGEAIAHFFNEMSLPGAALRAAV
jgi:UDP-N-acetylmuramoyl-tripeptide--D-alanyl-D-alanine ligase